MPPKGSKRKASDSNGTTTLLPPDRNNWPGWVELESEPALFNILLKDMGVRGVEIREVSSLDDDFMYTLPLPIHGLIFLFQYNDTDNGADEPGANVNEIWFANQVPEYACATIAILNLVNNIPGLDLGRELRDFKEFTTDMCPLMRGDTIDSFEFVKRIHNSFARENDMLNADMVTQDKVQKVKAAEEREKTRKAREVKAAAAASKKKANNATKSTGRTTGRIRRPPPGQAGATLTTSAAAGNSGTVVSSPSVSSGDSDPGYRSETEANSKAKEVTPALASPRRSTRRPKPRKVITAADFEEPEQGYHYVAYVPIGDHVWKLDGLDRYPQDLGLFGYGGNGADGGTGNWLDVVTPTIRNRMAQSSDINYSLMAVVRDPLFDERKNLLENVKTLQAVDLKLESLDPDWKSLEGGETRKDVITGISLEFEIGQKDIEDAELPRSAETAIADQDDLLKLIEYRQGVLKEQTMRRSGVRDAQRVPSEGEEDARLRKHDYGPFVRGWLSALVEADKLADLLD